MKVISRMAVTLTILGLLLVACGSNEGSNSASTSTSLAPIASPSASTATASTPLDGTYQTSFTRDELAAATTDLHEINDENWGDFTLELVDGRVTFTQENDLASYSTSGVFTVQGDAVTLDFDSGGNAGEFFAFRWSLDGNTLTFRRDESLGIGPTPYIVKPWTTFP